jgi:hypothetical protein
MSFAALSLIVVELAKLRIAIAIKEVATVIGDRVNRSSLTNRFSGQAMRAAERRR